MQKIQSCPFEQRIWLASHLGDELFTDDGSGAALKSPKGIDPNVVLAELRKLKELIQKKSAELAQKQKELEDRKAKVSLKTTSNNLQMIVLI